jgi:peptide/nickel transport system substrate-binding protein
MALPWATTSSAFDAGKNRAYSFDLDKARSLIAGSGVTGTSLEIVWPTTLPEFAPLAQIYQADLANLGLQVKLRPVQAAEYFAIRNNGSYQGILFGISSLGHLKPASNILGQSYGPEINLSNFKDDSYTQLANQVLIETDPTRQRVLYNELNDYYLDQAWVLPIVQDPRLVAAGTNVRGLRFDAHQALVPAEMWLT